MILISSQILSILYISLCEIFSLLGIVIVFGLILGVLKKYTVSFLYPIFGNKLILLTGLIGTPIHELGHAIMCVLFRHKIKKIKLFSLSSKDNVLGYVENTYDKMSIYQRIGNLFIAIGPLFSGIFVMYFIFSLLFSDSSVIFFNAHSNVQIDNVSIVDQYQLKLVVDFVVTFIQSVFSKFPTVNFWIFILLTFSISIHMTLSKADMKGLWDGLIFFSIFVLALNIILSFASVDINIIFNLALFLNSTILSFLSMALIFSLTFFILSAFLNKVLK